MENICTPLRQKTRLSCIGDGKRPDLLAPLMSATGAVNISKCEQLSRAFKHNLEAARGDRASVVSSAQRAWHSTVRCSEKSNDSTSPKHSRAPFHVY